jgi:4-diphosphocytidyl-2-C-methyl-D-erythritol kinase
MTFTRYAPAKLTLTLRMLDKRDDGFNNLEALTVFLPNVSDIVVASEGTHDFVLMGPAADDSLMQHETNLVVRARNLFEQHERIADLHDELLTTSLELAKSIPIAAGLGGGSADAAATLHVLNRICGDQLTLTELGWLAEELGSDVPACIYSQALWMKGRGEVVDPLDEFPEGLHVLVVTPHIECSTPAVYKRYEEMGRPVDEGIEAPADIAHLTKTLHNDLALAAYDLSPELVDIKETLEKETSARFMLAGSGSTLFCVGDKEYVSRSQQKISELGMSGLRLCATSELV